MLCFDTDPEQQHPGLNLAFDLSSFNIYDFTSCHSNKSHFNSCFKAFNDLELLCDLKSGKKQITGSGPRFMPWFLNACMSETGTS